MCIRDAFEFKRVVCHCDSFCCCRFLLLYECVRSTVTIFCVYYCVNSSDYRMLTPMEVKVHMRRWIEFFCIRNPKKAIIQMNGIREIKLRKITCEIPGRATYFEAINDRIFRISFRWILSMLPQLILCTIVNIATIPTACACAFKYNVCLHFPH